MYRLLTILFLLATAAMTAAAMYPADSVTIRFRAGQSAIEPGQADNYPEMRRFVNSVRRYPQADIAYILIRAYTSPDGTSGDNADLSAKRCKALAAFIRHETGISHILIKTEPQGIAWNALRDMVAADSISPWRDDVLSTLDNTPVWVFDRRGYIIGGRKKSLTEIGDGAAYRALHHKYFHLLHYAEATLFIKGERPAPLTKPLTEAQHADASAIISSTIPIPDSINPSHVRTLHGHRSLYPGRFALKTNMLYDAILMPSLEIEFRMSRKMSLGIEGQMAWWKKKQQHKCYQIAIVSPEIRYWFQSKSMLRGLYAGIFAGAGLYDLENGRKGYRGEGVMAGVSIGYSWPVSKHLSLEAGFGAGLMKTRYKEYTPFEGHHIYLRTLDTDYIGPLKARFALVWRFGPVSDSTI